MAGDVVTGSRATTTQLLEVHLEELGAHSWVKALLNTVTGSSATAQYRFVACPAGAEHPEADHVAVSGTFPMLRWADLDDATERGGWASEAREELGRLDRKLREEGWTRLPERGGHWWSLRFTR